MDIDQNAISKGVQRVVCYILHNVGYGEGISLTLVGEEDGDERVKVQDNVRDVHLGDLLEDDIYDDGFARYIALELDEDLAGGGVEKSVVAIHDEIKGPTQNAPSLEDISQSHVSLQLDEVHEVDFEYESKDMYINNGEYENDAKR